MVRQEGDPINAGQEKILSPATPEVFEQAVRKKGYLPDPLGMMMWRRPTIDASGVLADFKAQTDFEEREEHLRLFKDLIGMIRHHPGGRIETYSDKLRREEARGQNEAASYGMAELHGKEFGLFSMHWDFFAGSAGSVAGEKFVKAAEMSAKKKVPLVGLYSSSGIRQQENYPGLLQMQRIAHAIADYREESTEPYIAVLSHQVWGGISASAVPLADVTVGIAGTDYGFSGPNVIKSYAHKDVPEGAQSVEANVLNRNIDFLVNDHTELLEWLDTLLNHSHHGKSGKFTQEEISNLPEIAELSSEDRFLFGEIGASSLAKNHEVRNAGEEGVPVTVFEEGEKAQGDLYDQYVALVSDSQRPDAEYLLRQCFTDVVPLYNRVSEEKFLTYPAIIAALGRIGKQSYLIIGNQPSYQKIGGMIRKIHSSAGPRDQEYLQRMLVLGERLHIPTVFFTDTLGAKPTVEAEVGGQSRAIAESLLAAAVHKNPIITINIGVLGSGGGLTTSPIGDRNAMLENAMAFVAEPRAATAILYKTSNPSEDEVRSTTNSMRASAVDQLELGIIDSIIDEPNGGAAKDPAATAKVVRDYIAHETLSMQGAEASRLRKRKRKVKTLKGLPLHSKK